VKETRQGNRGGPRRIGPPEAWKCTGWARTGVGNPAAAGLSHHTLESQKSPGRLCFSPVPKGAGEERCGPGEHPGGEGKPTRGAAVG
jgi:hypothetical protein